MEDRDANEFAIVLAGYYRLIAGNILMRIRLSRIRRIYRNTINIDCDSNENPLKGSSLNKSNNVHQYHLFMKRIRDL